MTGNKRVTKGFDLARVPVEFALILLAWYAAVFLHEDGQLASPRSFQFLLGGLLGGAVKLIVLELRGARSTRGTILGLTDAVRLAELNALASVLFFAIAHAVFAYRFPIRLFVIDLLVCVLFTGCYWFSPRLYHEALRARKRGSSRKNILIYGAGQAGATLAREVQSNRELGVVVGFLDDDQRKLGTSLMGIPVRGTGRQAVWVIDRFAKRGKPISEIVIAMPSATGRQMREAVAVCRSTGLAFRTIPGIGELLKGKVLSAQIRKVSVVDLLSREAVQLDQDRIREKLTGRSVLVTGAAGSIGSELCRQIANLRPERLVAFDQAESELFKIENELRAKFPDLNLVPVIGDVRKPERLEEVTRREKIEALFHAAAYKHVPLMEANVVEALENNVIGTWNVAKAAIKAGVPGFLMISSDKAVNPTNIMGATKRAAELILSALEKQSAVTRFVAVRFGNVLGSNGSVVPTFQRQIEAGGPVTVTDPRMTRYFMTIPEASQLVLQASTMGQGSEVFVLDMGQPVLIADLARNMIRLAGLEPNTDIEIRYVGLRPGEKLFEELISEGENIEPSPHEKIKIFKGPAAELPMVERWMATLRSLLIERDSTALAHHLRVLVPEFTSEHWFADEVSVAKEPANAVAATTRRLVRDRVLPQAVAMKA